MRRSPITAPGQSLGNPSPTSSVVNTGGGFSTINGVLTASQLKGSNVVGFVPRIQSLDAKIASFGA